MRSDVRLCLDDLSGEIPAVQPADQNLAQQTFGNLERRSSIELTS